jgi:hypothetical protein
MTRRLLVLLAMVAGAGSLCGQSASDLNEGARVQHDTANAVWRLKWWGQSGRTYFIQHSPDLKAPWEWVPIVEPGNDALKEWGFTTSADRFFVRLRYSDIPTSDPAGADFDLDGVPNLWELQHGLDPLTVDSTTDADQDGLDAWAEFWLGTDPTTADSDGDGLNDGAEIEQGSDPLGSGVDGLVPPSNITAEPTPQGGYLVSWVNNDTNATQHILQRSPDGITWTTVAVVPNGTTSFTDQAAPTGMALLYALIATDR